MEHNLLVCKWLNRSKFNNETYVGKDDIFALVERGSFEFTTGGVTHFVNPMEAVNFKRNVLYERHIIETTDMYLFRYHADEDIFGSGKIIFHDRERIRSTLRLLHMSDSAVPLDDFTCKQALFRDLVVQFKLENAAQMENEAFGDELIRSVITYINSNFHQKINLTQLASQYYLSYIQFSRRFKRATGVTPQEYLANLRLKKAQVLLSETELPINQIARLCGFGNEYYFSNFFRKHAKHAPSQYRTLIKTADDEP